MQRDCSDGITSFFPCIQFFLFHYSHTIEKQTAGKDVTADQGDTWLTLGYKRTRLVTFTKNKILQPYHRQPNHRQEFHCNTWAFCHKEIKKVSSLQSYLTTNIFDEHFSQLSTCLNWASFFFLHQCKENLSYSINLLLVLFIQSSTGIAYWEINLFRSSRKNKEKSWIDKDLINLSKE